MNPENKSIIWKINDESIALSSLLIATIISLLGISLFKSPSNIFLISLLFYPFTILPIFYLCRFKYNLNFKHTFIYLGFTHPKIKSSFNNIFLNSISPYLLAAWIWILGLLIIGVWYYLINLSNINWLTPPNTGDSMPQYLSKSFFLFCTVAILIAPISEEIFFRGFLLKIFNTKYGNQKSVILNSLIFALFHLHIGAIIPVFILGLTISWIKIKTESLLPCIGIHIIQNSLAIILSITNI